MEVDVPVSIAKRVPDEPLWLPKTVEAKLPTTLTGDLTVDCQERRLKGLNCEEEFFRCLTTGSAVRCLAEAGCFCVLDELVRTRD